MRLVSILSRRELIPAEDFRESSSFESCDEFLTIIQMEIRANLRKRYAHFLLCVRECSEEYRVIDVAPHTEACDSARRENSEGFRDHLIWIRCRLQAEIRNITVERVSGILQFFAVCHFNCQTKCSIFNRLTFGESL